MKENKTIFRIKFFENDREKPIEALVRTIESSEFPGLVCFSEFVFKDNTKKIILPGEEESSKRFNKTKAVHIPYHNILLIEEIEEEKTDLTNLPFLKPLEPQKQSDQKDSK